MRSFFKWHRRQTEHFQKKFNLTHYEVMWIAFLKGLVMGLLLFVLL